MFTSEILSSRLGWNPLPVHFAEDNAFRVLEVISSETTVFEVLQDLFLLAWFGKQADGFDTFTISCSGRVETRTTSCPASSTSATQQAVLLHEQGPPGDNSIKTSAGEEPAPAGTSTARTSEQSAPHSVDLVEHHAHHAAVAVADPDPASTSSTFGEDPRHQGRKGIDIAEVDHVLHTAARTSVTHYSYFRDEEFLVLREGPRANSDCQDERPSGTKTSRGSRNLGGISTTITTLQSQLLKAAGEQEAGSTYNKKTTADTTGPHPQDEPLLGSTVPATTRLHSSSACLTPFFRHDDEKYQALETLEARERFLERQYRLLLLRIQQATKTSNKLVGCSSSTTTSTASSTTGVQQLLADDNFISSCVDPLFAVVQRTDSNANCKATSRTGEQVGSCSSSPAAGAADHLLQEQDDREQRTTAGAAFFEKTVRLFLQGPGSTTVSSTRRLRNRKKDRVRDINLHDREAAAGARSRSRATVETTADHKTSFFQRELFLSERPLEILKKADGHGATLKLVVDLRRVFESEKQKRRRFEFVPDFAFLKQAELPDVDVEDDTVQLTSFNNSPAGVDEQEVNDNDRAAGAKIELREPHQNQVVQADRSQVHLFSTPSPAPGTTPEEVRTKARSSQHHQEEFFADNECKELRDRSSAASGKTRAVDKSCDPPAGAAPGSRSTRTSAARGADEERDERRISCAKVSCCS
ncbi:unnamed protein product [Amoebophrya sp. A120]|nr:unnamed protein product [Amoebophrya sp. A120]|eukprot:GSA120T00007515001.1